MSDSASPNQIRHSYRTARALTRALQLLIEAGAKPEQSRSKLPEGVNSVQELDEEQAKQYLQDLGNLYVELKREKRSSAPSATTN